jgi:hypothetical protein
MFSIEHEFDGSVITLVDENTKPLREDVVIIAFDDCVTIEQHDARIDRTQKITLSLSQVRDLQAALNLPEGTYRIGRTD